MKKKYFKFYVSETNFRKYWEYGSKIEFIFKNETLKTIFIIKIEIK